jgi:hypothetical protein
MRSLRRDYASVMFHCIAAAALLFACAFVANAQVVRGVVRDRETGAPVPGVVVTLDEAVERLDTDAALRRSSLVLAVLSDDRGEFAIRAGFAGRFVLTAKQVGLTRFQSAPFALAVGQTHRLEVNVSPIDFTATLAAVTVLTDAPCSVRPTERRHVAALWEEARTALTASRLSLRDRQFRATVVRYVRQLAPRTLRVLHEERTTKRGVVERAFLSLAAADLTSSGYVQPDGDGGNVWYAPDAAVLTSSEFLRDHCFSVAAGGGRTPGLVGLAFEPVKTRRLPDIRGAMWMDSATFELRRVEFSYVGVDPMIKPGDAGGEVRFTRLANGSWFVSRWHIRMPQLGRVPAPAGVVFQAKPEITIVQYKEEGGDVVPDGARSEVRTAVLTGRALDSTGRAPLRGSTVRIAGTPYESRVLEDGLFRIDSLPAGAYTLVLSHPVYGALGMLAAEQDLEIAEGSSSVTALQAAGTSVILGRLCGIRELAEDQVVARVTVSSKGAPVPAAVVRLHFETFSKDHEDRLNIHPTMLQVTTDSTGSARYCDVRARTRLRFEHVSADGKDVLASQTLIAPPGSILAILLEK